MIILNNPVQIDSSAIIGSFGSAVTTTIELIMGLVPLALTIFTTIWAIKLAMRFFRGTAKG